MTDRAMTRRHFIRRASGLVLATAGGLVAAGARPQRAEAAHYCGFQFGPIHQHIFATSIAPDFVHDMVWRESGFDPYATNPYSSAAGLGQFLWSTWRYGEGRFGIYGSPYDWQLNLAMVEAFIRAGEFFHWDCGPNVGCVDVPH